MARHSVPDGANQAREVIATEVDREIATEPDLCINCGQPLPHTVMTCLDSTDLH